MQRKINMQASSSFSSFPSAALSALSTHKNIVYILKCTGERKKREKAGFAGLGFRHEKNIKQL